MASKCILTFAVVCAVLALGCAAPAPAPQPEPATGFDSHPDIAPEEAENNAPASDSKHDGLTPVVIPEHVHLVDKRSPHKKYGYGGGGYGGGGYGGGGCNVCGGGGGGYPVQHGGGGYGGGGSYSQSSSSSQSSSGSWGRK